MVSQYQTACQAPSSAEMMELQWTKEALKTQENLTSVLREQFEQKEKAMAENMAFQMVAAKVQEEALQKEMEDKNKRMQRLVDTFINTECSVRNYILDKFKQKDKGMHEEIAQLKEKVATEANL